MATNSKADAVHVLIKAFGASFGPQTKAPAYEVSFDGAAIRVTTDHGDLLELASEWKRLCGRLWAQALPREQGLAIGVILPTLCEFDGSVWAPMSRLLESRAVAAALRSLESSLRAKHPIEAMCCRHSAAFSRWGYSTTTFNTGKVFASIENALEAKGALAAMPLVKLPLDFLDCSEPLERLRALVWVREAMSESPANVLGIHRLLLGHVLPLCRDGEGLWREGATSIVERWVRRLVARGAHPEALPLLDDLLRYGVAIPKFLALRYETLLALNEPDEAERTMARLRAIADESGHIRFPLAQFDQHVDDTRALALCAAAKLFHQLASGEHPFGEKRLKGERQPPRVPPDTASELSRDYASAALKLLQSRAKKDVTVKIPVNYAFYTDWMKKLLA